MTDYIVLVEFEVVPANASTFRQALRENARISLETEPGCKQFDVVASTKNPNKIILYEVYRSKEDFDRHLKADHYLEFDSHTAGYVLSKQVETLVPI